MAGVHTVASYPEQGFAILEDDKGKFLMFEDLETLVPILDDTFVILHDLAEPPRVYQ